VADEPTLGEVARRLEAIHADLKEDLREYGARLEKKVSVERYELERRTADDVHRQVIERVAAIEVERAQEKRDADQERRKAEDQRRADKRLILTGLIVPVLLVLLQVYLSARGAGA
jgi:predicted acylesterase/phospholipase RssA